MSSRYKCLSVQHFKFGRHELIPIRNDDRYAIMHWRNDQIDVLRQKELLTKESQDLYFENVVKPLFDEKYPSQLLFSFLEDGELIGYGGLVHINWSSKNAEVSFITNTTRSRNVSLFVQDWINYLRILKSLVEANNLFTKVYTYAYDLRPPLYEALTHSFFCQEARLKEHVFIRSEYRDVLIHSYFFRDLEFREATHQDVILYFNWANDPLVRRSSFNEKEIELEEHKKWFELKLHSQHATLLVATKCGKPIGQIRFDAAGEGIYEIDFSLDTDHRGKNMGSDLLRQGTENFFKLKPSTKKVIAKVKATNIASGKSFERAGFIPVRQETPQHVNTYYFDNRLI
jgi:RimJ/RimL family protein N-acetyltransferase